MAPPVVTITVCARNAASWVDGCLQALCGQTHPNFEIVAVNDGSTDRTGAALDAWADESGERGPPVRVVHQPPLGLSAGRQRALEVAQGEWVAITDIDVRPEPDWLQHLVAASHPVEGEAPVVAVTGRTVFERAQDLVSWHRSVEISAKYRSRPRHTSLANGPCSMFHRTSLVDVGGFDPRWYHAEDMEVSLRLIRSGGGIVYTPDAVVRHVPETGIHRFLSKRARDARAHLRIVRRYPANERRQQRFDFLGSSTAVLGAFPWTLAFALLGTLAFAPGVSGPWVLTPGATLAMKAGWVTLLLIQLSMMWGGSLGSVNREVLRQAPRSRLMNAVLLHGLVLAWSLALWYGIMCGISDAVLRRHGH